MTRFAAIALVAAVLLSSFAPAADAACHHYKHFQIENNTGRCLNYSISWDGGRTWERERLCDGTKRLYWNPGCRVDAEIRFDADLGDGVAWREYDLDVGLSEYEPSFRTPTHSYHFEIEGRMLDIYR